ncbi:MAG: DUF2382 domain-containing protein [Chroococcidiopsidaceae cyanobacterium CP_BM_RX_35]|nr:DUF2382 domain-containing protein [Chroococcidiopsidaceae cyanobacterium CP_BM_RX_35]
MPLLKIDEFAPHYRETLGDDDLKGLDVYSTDTNDKIGTISDVLVDEAGHFRYLIIDLGFWVFGKRVLLPIGRAQHNHGEQQVFVSLTKAQVEALPEFNENRAVDYAHEEQVREVYRNPAATASLNPSAPLGAVPTASSTGATPEPTNPIANRDTYAYHQEPSLYELNDRDHQTIKLYQERLLADKARRKTGDVVVGKHVETEMKRVSVPIEKERIVIERITPADAGKVVAPGTVDFREGEVAHMEVYEESADIHKEAFVREEIRVNKVVEHETVEVQDTIRREELDIDAGGQTIEDRTGRLPNDRV